MNSFLRLAAKTPGVDWKDFVDDAEYEHLLSTCAVFALPSLYEGFGMQILDAMQRGIPVLTSDRGSLPEVAGTGAVLVNPEDVSSIARGLERLLTDTNVCSNLRLRGKERAAMFSWKRTVDVFVGILERVDL